MHAATPNPVQTSRLKICVALGIDGRRPRRHSTDTARSAWYARHRSVRFSRLGSRD